MAGMSTPAIRSEVLERLGAPEAVRRELLAYNTSAFEPLPIRAPGGLPLAPAPHVAAWRGYVRRADEIGVLEALREALVQLRFPIEAGMSATDAYRAATLRGVVDAPLGPGEGLRLEEPGSLRLSLHEAPAGPVPVLVVPHRADFVAVVRALASRNEPSPMPESMGAVTVKGLNNWERIGRLRRAWEDAHPGARPEEWQAHFREQVVPCRELYQDVVVVLSRGEYSHVPAEALGLEREDWLERSSRIRLDHECCHYFTMRACGFMQNRLLDELLADFAGVVASEGRFRADWFLRFMGLEGYPAYRAGGRFENYLGTPPLSEEAIRVERAVLCEAARAVEAFDAAHPVERGDLQGLGVRILVLARFTLEELAHGTAMERLEGVYREVAG